MKGREGDYQRLKSKGPGPLLPVLSFWSLSFHDPFSRRVCDPGLVLNSSHLIYSTQAHTLTQADTNSHTDTEEHPRNPKTHGLVFGHSDTLLRQRAQGHSGATLHSQSSNMAPGLHMHTYN